MIIIQRINTARGGAIRAFLPGGAVARVLKPGCQPSVAATAAPKILGTAFFVVSGSVSKSRSAVDRDLGYEQWPQKVIDTSQSTRQVGQYEQKIAALEVRHFLSRGFSDDDHSCIVAFLSRTHAMYPLHHPTVTDGEMLHEEDATNHVDLETMPATDMAISSQSSNQDIDCMPPVETTMAETSTKKLRGESECQQIRDLMPDYLLHTLDREGVEKVDVHVRECQDCFTMITDLDIGIMSALEEARERRKQR